MLVCLPVNTANPTVVHQGRIDYVRELQRALERAGVASWIVPQPGGG